MDRVNSTSAPLTVPVRYKLTGPSGVLLDLNLDASAPVSEHSEYIELVLLSTAPSASFTFEASLTYGGITTSRTSTFTVIAASGLSTETAPAKDGMELPLEANHPVILRRAEREVEVVK